MANLNELKPVGKLNPFAKFCCTIGNLPTSYMISLTYEEQLLWLCNYLENTVIPAVNTNAEAVQELQELYIILKNYVDNYFENLDVQEEINNKLDEMVNQGTLQEIIADYLNSKAIFGFDNVETMLEASNLLDGSYARTLGYYEKNDGGGALYKIRTKVIGDITNTITLLQMDNDNLVAELIIENDTISIKQAGAIGNGENVTSILQALIDYQIILNKSLTIFIPSGNYGITSVTIPYATKGLKIIGENQTNNGSVFVGIESSQNYMINFGTDYGSASVIINNFVKNCSIENITFDGNQTRLNCLNITTATLCNFKNLNIFGFLYDGITINTIFDSIFDNCYIHNNAGFYGSTPSNDYAAIHIKDYYVNVTNATRFVNCDLEANGQQLKIESKANQIMFNNCKIENSSLENGDLTALGIYIYASGEIMFNNCQLTQCGSSDSYNENYLINLINSELIQTTFDGCMFDCSGYGENGGLFITYNHSSGYAKGGIINACTFKNTNTSEGCLNLYYGQVVSNCVFKCGKKTQTTLHLIDLASRCTVKDCYVYHPGLTSGEIFTISGTENEISNITFSDLSISTYSAYLVNSDYNKKNKIAPFSHSLQSVSNGSVDGLRSHFFLIASANLTEFKNINSGDIITCYCNTSVTIAQGLLENVGSALTVQGARVFQVIGKDSGKPYLIRDYTS